MNEMDHIKPAGTFDLVTPVPDGYEMASYGSTLIAVDPAGVKPTLFFSFPARNRGWHSYPPNFAPVAGRV